MSVQGWADQWIGTAHMTWQIGPPSTGETRSDYKLTAEAFMTFEKHDTYPDGLESYQIRDATINYLASGTVANRIMQCNIYGSAKHYIDGSKLPGHGLGVYGPSTLPSSPNNRMATGRVIDGELWQRTQDCGKYGTFQIKVGDLSMFFEVQEGFHVSEDYMSFIDGYDDPVVTRPDGLVKVRRSWDLQFKKGGIAPDINPACPNRTITFQPIGSPPLGPVTWSCDGNPATGTGTVFQTRFDTPGDHTVKATETTQSGTRTATTQVHISEHSGRRIAERYPGSHDLNDLQDTDPNSFQQRVRRFIQALRQAGATVDPGSTYRSDQTQYLMHYAWRILNGKINPANVPPWPGIDICWDWLKEDGTQDLDASSEAAQEIVNFYHMGTNPAAAPGKSHHRDHLAVDLSISWHGDITIGDTTLEGGTGDPREDGMNEQLWDFGHDNYGVTHNQGTGPRADPPHWSNFPDGS